MISSTYIKDYLLSKFEKNSKLASGGTELIVPSIFIEDDWKMHMSINLETGLFQCFKSKKKGNFIHLYAYLENTSFKKAYDELSYQSFVHDEDPREHKKKVKVEPEEIPDLEKITVLYPEQDNTSETGMLAWSYLFSRKLFNEEENTETYFVCHEGKYKDRIIFPFYVGSKMVFFQARALFPHMYPKYLNPSEIEASDIIVPFDLDRASVYVTEGPTDMIALRLAGYNATCTFGSVVSELQADSLRSFPGKIILAYDSDLAGNMGISRFENLRLRKRMGEFWRVSPPQGEDWNSLWSSGRLKNLSPKLYNFEERILREIV